MERKEGIIHKKIVGLTLTEQMLQIDANVAKCKCETDKLIIGRVSFFFTISVRPNFYSSCFFFVLFKGFENIEFNLLN